METALHSYQISSEAGAKVIAAVPGPDKVTGIYVDSNNTAMFVSVPARYAEQAHIATVASAGSGAQLLTNKTTIAAGSKTFGALTHVWISLASKSIEKIAFRAGSVERIANAESISGITAKHITLSLAPDAVAALPLYRDDKDLLREINQTLNAILLDPRVRHDVHVSVENGEVDLSGIVSIADSKEKAVRGVEAIQGVIKVRADIIVTESLADQVMREINTLIEKGALGENPEVDVLSEHQIIYLMGEVDSPEKSAAAEAAAVGVNGARVVVNNLQTRKAENTTRADPTSPKTRTK